ncbi:unnamed protein product [Rotaria magnacalcarata]|uniref:arylamine N-acetyltransferase n=1 Tax=Rotaria magnacalcarata TaxID=392030 RepID=A0A816LV20_9BILA|nr:unnamed protein product [Rotaria magnacalcarata]CAF2139720.1 unnamed protein product [Rotaria magnacalcarata]CAF3917917.1 unnamed protein product [Rotaria magnacalcarata]CAF3986450.1 unnamed protein product [Rotaria magnacalcarata]
MANDNRLDEYLKRIESSHPTNGCTEEYLNRLQVAHLTHIPFETFDLIDIKLLNISMDHRFDRLVRQNRGGVCFQMNGLFADMLRKLNYNVKIISCSVYNEGKHFYIEPPSHAALFVRLDNGKTFLCDVGFSNDFLTPLFFELDSIQYATNGFFRLTKTDDQLYYKLERGYLNTDDSISLPTSSTPRTHIIDIDSGRIKWTISYRFPIDFLESSTEIDDFQNVVSNILYSPNVFLNHLTICRLHTYKPNVGAYSIIGKKYYEWIIENGKETRHKYYSISDNENELKTLLKEKFDLTIERKIELVDNRQ